MKKLRHRTTHVFVKPAVLVCGFAIVVLAVLSCGPNQGSDPRMEILEDQVKMLVITEAQQGFSDLFKTNFAAEKTRLLVGADLEKWFQEHPAALKPVPDEIKESITSRRGMGLLIQGGLPGKNGGAHDVVYLRPPRFGIRRFFTVVQPDPCGDGNPATCENCTGCSGAGAGGGIIHTCVCTTSCDQCRACPTC